MAYICPTCGSDNPDECGICWACGGSMDAVPPSPGPARAEQLVVPFGASMPPNPPPDRPLRLSDFIRPATSWTRVRVPRGEIHFPFVCPNCLEENVGVGIREESSRMTGYYVVASRHETMALTIPYCERCAQIPKWARLIGTIVGVIGFIPAMIIAATNDLPSLLFVFVIMVGIGPGMAIATLGKAAKLDSHDASYVEFEFRESKYADFFVEANQGRAKRC